VRESNDEEKHAELPKKVILEQEKFDVKNRDAMMLIKLSVMEE
jgi:hypothetical protein